jgi:hypothetical protein
MRTAALLFAATSLLLVPRVPGQEPPTPKNALGVQMRVDPSSTDPALRVTLPGGPEAERSFTILMPEHVTVRLSGQEEPKHLYVFQPGVRAQAPQWRRAGNALGYTQLFGTLRFTARATLERDGIRFRYTFQSTDTTSYATVTAVTDPRMRAFFYDPRLERTFVHHADGFQLLARETPARLSEPLSAWFPARYHAQRTAPIPAKRVQHRDDGITYYYDGEPTDLPMIATLSVDGKWVAASFTREVGNVWTNPELTCQHVDPEVPLHAGESAGFEVKLLLVRGGLEQARTAVERERPELWTSAREMTEPK